MNNFYGYLGFFGLFLFYCLAYGVVRAASEKDISASRAYEKYVEANEMKKKEIRRYYE